jgi:lambda family phage portal protein
MAMSERIQRPTPRIGWLDRAILAIAPTWGMQRLAARRGYDLVQSNFARIEAAEHNDARGSRWLISRMSPDSQLEQDLVTTRERSRDIYQNDALGGAVDNKVNHVIGTGHTPQARVRAFGTLDESSAETINAQIESVYERWNCRADRTGLRSLWMLSRLAARHNEFDGESFTVLSDVGRASKPIPLALQVVDPERIATPPEMSGDRSVRLGIKRSESGEILGYYVQQSHPGDTKNVGLRFDYVTADRMLHVYEPWFAEQSRGLPWMTRALNRARDAKDYDEATILAAQVEACFAAFVKPGLGGGPGGFASAVGAATGTNGSNRIQDITPGTITHLNPGEEITGLTPTRPGNGFGPFMEWNYRRVAAAINWPYEMVVKNWNGLSFAAGRLVLTDAKKATEVSQQIMREMWLERVWNRMVEEAVIVGEVEIDPRDYMADPFEFNRHVWIAPKWEYALNPGEDVKADMDEIVGNLATVEDKLLKRGYDLTEFIARRKREKKLLAESGLNAEAAPAPNAPGAGRPPMPTPMNPDGAPAEPQEDPQEDPTEEPQPAESVA